MSGRRYLTAAEAAGALRRSRQIEQFLECYVAADGRTAVRWLTAYTSGRTFELVIHEVEDIGTDGFFDVSAFPPLDDKEYMGEGRAVATADVAEALLDAALDHGASTDRWVNFGVVQDEYADSRIAP
jgi:hypothetical protein